MKQIFCLLRNKEMFLVEKETPQREWRAIFKLRTAPAAHPDMRRVMIPLLYKLKTLIPIIFDAIEV